MPICKPEYDRVREAYVAMAKKARCRPEAQSNCIGIVQLSDEELAEPERLANEAHEYAVSFTTEENSCRFEIGLSG